MLLTFSRDSFVEAIKAGKKIHTIRKDEKNRWKEGNTIQFWRGNPRNVKNNPYCFGTGKCTDVGYINIYPTSNRIEISFYDSKWITFSDINALNDIAVDDGFKDWEDMKTWFKEDFKGKLIYFGEFESKQNKIIVPAENIIKVEDLDISMLCLNRLRRAGIDVLNKLCLIKKEDMKNKGFGHNTLRELDKVMKEKGLLCLS